MKKEGELPVAFKIAVICLGVIDVIVGIWMVFFDKGAPQ